MGLVLVSDEIFLKHAQTLSQRALNGRIIVPVSEFSPGVSDRRLAEIEAAFLSSDVLGESTKMVLTPAMQRFCDLLTAADNLRWLQIISVGTDRPIFQQLMARGVVLTTSAGVTSETVALTALTGLLALSRRVPSWVKGKAERRWIPLRSGDLEPHELRGQRVVIVGAGNIGTALGKMCQALGLETVGIRRQAGVSTIEGFDRVYGADQLGAVVHDADWVVAACPLTPETQGLFNAALFARFKPTASFINVSRGGVAVDEDLIQALDAGHLEGAYLDVFETEPLPADSAFWRMDNVLLSPHSAGDSRGRHLRLFELFVGNLERYVNGQPLVNHAQA